MPQESRNYTEPMQDGRRKLHPDEYKEVRKAYDELHSQRKVAKLFGVSRRLVTFILDPEKLKVQQRQNILNKHHLKYHNTEKRRLYMRTYRAKKRRFGLMIIKTKPRKSKIQVNNPRA